MQKNVASQVIGAQLVSATDGSAFTGSVTCYVTGDGGTQAVGSVGSGACTHEGNGYHTYAPAQAETNYDLIAFTFTGTGAVPVTVQVFTALDVRTKTGFALSSTGLASVSTWTVTITGSLSGSVGSVTGNVGGSVASVTGNVGGNVTGSVGSVASGGIASTSFATGAITAAALAADAGTEIGRAVWDVDISGDLTSGLAGNTLYANVYTPLANLIADIGANGSGLTALPWNASWDAEVQSECTDALNAYDPPTNTEMVAAFTEIKGATWATTDTLEAIRDRGDAAWTTATGFSTHSAADVRTEIDSNSTQLAAIVADTNELQTDWANGGRLDLILDTSAALFTTTLSESYRAADAVGTPSQILQEILQGMSDFVISGTTKTVRKRDSATTAKTYTLNNGTTPTGITEAT